MQNAEPLLPLGSFRNAGDWGARLFRPVSRRTVCRPWFPVGFLDLGDGVGKQSKNIAEAAPNAFPPVRAFLADVTIFFVPAVEKLPHRHFSKRAKRSKQV